MGCSSRLAIRPCSRFRRGDAWRSAGGAAKGAWRVARGGSGLPCHCQSVHQSAGPGRNQKGLPKERVPCHLACRSFELKTLNPRDAFRPNFALTNVIMARMRPPCSALCSCLRPYPHAASTHSASNPALVCNPPRRRPAVGVGPAPLATGARPRRSTCGGT